MWKGVRMDLGVQGVKAQETKKQDTKKQDIKITQDQKFRAITSLRRKTARLRSTNRSLYERIFHLSLISSEKIPGYGESLVVYKFDRDDIIPRQFLNKKFSLRVFIPAECECYIKSNSDFEVRVVDGAYILVKIKNTQAREICLGDDESDALIVFDAP